MKQKYNISSELNLILFKSEYYMQGINIPFIKYDIIHPITKEILDLNFCQDLNIELDIPVIIDEKNIFKHDPKSYFYTDICNSSNNENGVDLTLFDRKNEYKENN